MFGNTQGWTISAVMLVVAAGALIYLAQPPKESVPHDAVPLAFKPISLPIPADSVQPLPTENCDAAEPYRQAIDTYLENPKPYQQAARVDVSEVPAVALIVKGASCSRMHLFDMNPSQAISYGAKPWIEAVTALGQATDDAGLRLRKDHPEEAQKYYEAAFELGRKLFEERVSWDEMNKGLSIMSMSADAMATLADMRKDGAKVDAYKHFADGVKNYQATLQEKVASPLGNPVESYSAPYAGDVFAAAKDITVERPWRVEAIMHMGHYRWDVVPQNKGDQIWAPRELDNLEKSMNPKNQDPAIKTAVKAAQNLTADQHHMTGVSL
jgi:hypothetical protein